MKKIFTICAMLVSVVPALPADKATASAIVAMPTDVAALKKLIKPTESEEKWTKIPWRTSLWEARIEAAKTGKPMLLWEMDGHPLGCT